MQFLENLKLKWKLLLLVTVPVICLLYFAQEDIRKSIRNSNESEHLQMLAEFAVKATALVHELQKERGETAGFLGSNGNEFGESLKAQRILTDTKTQELFEYQKKLDLDFYRPEFVENISDVKDELSSLAEMRAQVDNLTVPTKKVIGFFSNINRIYLETISFLSTSTSNSALSNMATAYVNFLNSKERAGIERAVLTSVFSFDRFPSGMYERFQDLMTTQEIYLRVFRSLATEEQIEFYLTTLSGEHIEATNNMRQIATEKSLTGSFGINPSDWFKSQTAKINLLKIVEDKLSNDIQNLATMQANSSNVSLMLSIVITLGALGITALFVYTIQNRITQPIRSSLKIASAIAEGRLDNDIPIQSTDESGQLLTALEAMQSNLRKSRDDLKKQMELERIQAAENGRIKQALDNVTANVMVSDEDLNIIYMNKEVQSMFDKNQQELKKEIPAFNADKLLGQNIDAFHKDPSYQRNMLKNLTSTHEAEIIIGRHVFKIIANPVFDEDKKRLGTVVEWEDLTSHRQAEKQIEVAIQSAVAGKLDTRLDIEQFDGFLQVIAEGVNKMLDAIVGPLTVASNYLEKISSGNIPKPITDEYKGDFNKIKRSLNASIESINRLVSDANELSDAAIKGRLDKRADANKHNGDFKLIIEGVNRTLDAVISPLKTAANYVERISQGDIPDPIEETYKGDFNTIKNNLNTCISAINLLIDDAAELSKSAVMGELSARADSSKHQGDFRKIIDGVNKTLDAVINPLKTAANYVERISKGDIPEHITDKYQGDFNAIKNNLNTCIDAIQLLIDDAGSLADAAVKGLLEKRANADAHQGDFKKIVQGINNTLEEIVNPINLCKDVMITLADGDLTNQINTQLQGDFSDLKDAVNASVTNLFQLVNKILTTSNLLSESSTNIEQGVYDLSQRTEEQASSLEETAASLEELTATVKQNTESSQHANEMANQANEQAKLGGEVVTQAITAMEEINDSSRKIADIIGVIDEIAFQTNLLALNAAVEAARAGEQGKGFSVVASEVRDLAGRSSEAAKDIKNLINDSVFKVQEGTRLVNESGSTLSEIVTSVTEMTNIMADISRAGEEQYAGINQVNQAVTQMDQMTQQNAALASEASSSSQAMNQETRNLINLISAFKVE